MLGQLFAVLPRLFSTLQDHGFLGNVALAVVTAIGFLHLLVFFISEFVDVIHKVIDIFT